MSREALAALAFIRVQDFVSRGDLVYPLVPFDECDINIECRLDLSRQTGGPG